MVGAISYTQLQDTSQVAQAPATVRQEAVRVALPKETNDYLLAHQSYSARGSLQGVAPYVRTVSDTARPR